MDTAILEKSGKIFILAYDQGFEHGPTDFNEQNYHGNFILKIALEGNASCVAMHYGMAKQYYTPDIAKRIPLILKLNGKTNLYSKNVHQALTGNIDDAKRLGAVAIGMTINPGQVEENVEFSQFCELRREAEKNGLLTVIWSYGRGPEIENQYSKEIVAYSSRTAAELGADIVKVKYTGDPETFKWAVQVAGKTKVIASGTNNFEEGDYVENVKNMLKSGAAGLAVGRRVWQDPEPIALAQKVAAAIYNN